MKKINLKNFFQSFTGVDSLIAQEHYRSQNSSVVVGVKTDLYLNQPTAAQNYINHSEHWMQTGNGRAQISLDHVAGSDAWV
jgi:hypothetical protein